MSHDLPILKHRKPEARSVAWAVVPGNLQKHRSWRRIRAAEKLRFRFLGVSHTVHSKGCYTPNAEHSAIHDIICARFLRSQKGGQSQDYIDRFVLPAFQKQRGLTLKCQVVPQNVKAHHFLMTRLFFHLRYGQPALDSLKKTCPGPRWLTAPKSPLVGGLGLENSRALLSFDSAETTVAEQVTAVQLAIGAMEASDLHIP